MEALEIHKHPLEQAADAARFVVNHLVGGAWADLPRPVALEPQTVLPNITAMYRETV